MSELLRRKYRIRRAALHGKEITIPPDASLELGERVLQIYDGFLLIVPTGSKVDEHLLRRAIKVRK